MQVSPISFGKKIPTYSCQIKEKETDKNIPATFYEYDCRDESDYEEVRALNRRWVFKDNIAQSMEMKHAIQTYLNQQSTHRFYGIEANGEQVGLVQVNNYNGISNIDYITTKPRNEYQYVGQTMISGVGKEFLRKNGFLLTVATAIDDVIPFYKKLGFKEHGDSLLKMNSDEVKDLIFETEFKTEAQMINLRA